MEPLEVPNFCPGWFSTRWIRSKCIPDMTKSRQKHVIRILETGLLFREDAIVIEDALQIEEMTNPPLKLTLKSYKPYFKNMFTPGEKMLCAVAVGVCIVFVPIKLNIGVRSNLLRMACWAGAGASTPIIKRALLPRSLLVVSQCLQEYTLLARKGFSSVKNHLFASKNMRGSPLNALNNMLISQQKELTALLHSANTAIQSACPWLPLSNLFDDQEVMLAENNTDDLLKMHYGFLIVQSTFLKNVALAHLPPVRNMKYLNINDRIYWIHSTILPLVHKTLSQHTMSLEAAYKYYKEYSAPKDIRTLPKNVHNNNNRDSWQFSEVHVGLGYLISDLQVTLNTCNEMDSFLEACFAAKSKFSPSVLEEDLGKIRDELMKCLNSVENMNVKLRKIRTAEMKLLEAAVQKLPLPAVQEEEGDNSSSVKTVSEDTQLPIEDQVFYFEKVDEDFGMADPKAEDYLTGPGKNEIKATKIVLGELKVKLVDREKEMREREAKALVNTMPEYKGKVPEFPSQICPDGKAEKNGHLSDEIDGCTNSKNGINGKELEYDSISSDETYSDDSASGHNHSELLKDVRKHRITRKKNYPPSRKPYEDESKSSESEDEVVVKPVKRNPVKDVMDEGMRPVEYSFGTGMAMASLLQTSQPNKEQKKVTFGNLQEEMFVGDGEVSEDSGKGD